MNGILALGAESKTSFSFLRGDEMFTGSAVNDLKDPRNFKAFREEIETFINKGHKPLMIVCDMHPDYLSTVLAEEIHGEHSRSMLVKVQHHHAHVASCMFDNYIKGDVIGVSFDGTGYGTDGNSWGGEFFICSMNDFHRKYHLMYVPAPGADKAALEPWRMAVSFLREAYGKKYLDLKIPLFDRIGRNKIAVIDRMMEKKVNSPVTSSMGRLFDAVASLAGISDISASEAQTAIMLEKSAENNIDGSYDYFIRGEVIDVSVMIRQIVRDVSEGVAPAVISAKFHNTVSEMVYQVSLYISRDTGIKNVVLSGGCFQNRLLMDCIDKRFNGSGLELFKHSRFSTTDLGISIGQAAVAANTF